MFYSCNSEVKSEKKHLRNQAVKVNAYVVTQTDYTNILSSVGTLVSNEEIDILSPINGKVLKINFQEGKSVSKGQLLVQLDSRSYESQLHSSEINLANLKKEYSRQKEIFKLNGISQEELEKTESSISQTESTIEQLKVSIDYCEIRAPFSGFVGLRNISPGSYLLQGQKITNLVNKNPIKIEFAIPSEFAGQIEVNSSVQIVSKSSEDTLEAKVFAIEPSIDVNTRNITVKAMANNPKGKYLPGDFVQVFVKLAKMHSVIFVPAESIVPKINEQTVFIVKNGIAKETTITTGLRDDSKIQVTSGLNVGDTVMTTGLVNIIDKAKVKIAQLINIK